MDTRSKILTAPPHAAGRLALVTGFFDPMLAWHASALARAKASADALLVIIQTPAGELLPARARAELVAALRVVDYVLIAEKGDLDRLFAELKPAEIVRFDADDLRRREELMQHVRSRQNR